jgi:predicted porin
MFKKNINYVILANLYKQWRGNRMKKFLAVALLWCLGCIFFISAASAEVVFNYGASERIRQEIWDNLLDLSTMTPTNTNYDRNFFRFKTSLWGSADFNKDTSIYLKFTSEVYYNLGPYKQPAGTGPKITTFTRLDENEGVVDNLYVKANNVFGLPVDLKIGRQDFLGPDMYGEGFLISDGNPNDGSRCFYFNAAKAKWRINENHSVDFVYITDQQRDTYLPTWRTDVPDAGTYYKDKKILNASDEQAFVVYGRNKLSENLTVEPYYIFKKEDSFQFPFGSKKPLDVTPSLDLNTIGARAVYKTGPWTAGGEFAHQFGEYDGGRDRSAYGGYIFGNLKFADMTLKPEFELRFVSLSGDNPNTKKDENWDPLFSRAPYWNELLIYTQIYETVKEGYAIPGYWTNSQLYMAKASVNLTPDTKLSLSYQYWVANQPANTLANFQKMFGTGHERGHLPTLFLTHKFNKNIDAFFQYEYFIPGNFYADNAKNGQFLRWQLQFKI